MSSSDPETIKHGKVKISAELLFIDDAILNVDDNIDLTSLGQTNILLSNNPIKSYILATNRKQQQTQV